MELLIGFLLFLLGGSGSYGTYVYISNDRRYTYSAPLTDHEVTMIATFVICLIIAAVGVIIMIFSLWKKSNEDTLDKIMNTQEGGKLKNVCKQCGLNLAEGTKTCPRCGTVIIEEGELDIWPERK